MAEEPKDKSEVEEKDKTTNGELSDKDIESFINKDSEDFGESYSKDERIAWYIGRHQRHVEDYKQLVELTFEATYVSDKEWMKILRTQRSMNLKKRRFVVGKVRELGGKVEDSILDRIDNKKE